MSVSHAIQDRELGQFPISIGTSLAIESALGVHPDIVTDRAPVREYTQLWVNMRTLFRNLWGSINKQYVSQLEPEQLAQALAEEVEFIVAHIREHTQGKVEVVPYYSNFQGIENTYNRPPAQLRMDNTEKQRIVTAMHNATMEAFLPAHEGEVKLFMLKIKAKDAPKAMIVTHYAIDLLSHPDFLKLTLLESHTGAIKDRSQWYTKYYEGKDLARIPFREDMLQVFGDKETFHPADIRLRRAIIEIAERYQWTSLTTTDKIRYGIETLQNPLFKEIMRAILSH